MQAGSLRTRRCAFLSSVFTPEYLSPNYKDCCSWNTYNVYAIKNIGNIRGVERSWYMVVPSETVFINAE